jgi:hypothetical protein
MVQYCVSYFWKNGYPLVNKCVNEKKWKDEKSCYALISDPYHKRVTIEHYQTGGFISTIYDSYLFDFRLLKLEEPLSWDKELVEDEKVVLLRDQDGRIVIKENHLNNTECKWLSVHDCFIATQKWQFKSNENSFNTVVLSDAAGVVVMKKHYSDDLVEVIQEYWG